MNVWTTTALCAAMVAGTGIGAAVAPVAEGQTTVRQAPRARALEVIASGGRIGISLRDVDEDDVTARKLPGIAGAVIEEVTEDSPAEQAGMKEGDVVVEFDGERVRSVRQLTRLVQETPAGRKVQVALMRDGQRMNVTVEPRAGSSFFYDDAVRGLERFTTRIRPTPPPRAVAPRVPGAWRFDSLLGRLGVTIDSLSSQLAEYFGTKEGVLVTSVEDGSAASKAGLKAGDVITSFNGSAVDEPSDLNRRLQSADDGAEFTIEVMRDRKAMTLKGKLERQERRRTFRTIL